MNSEIRQPGMDNEYYEFLPIESRERLIWPDGAPLALCVIVNLEHYEWDLSKIENKPQSMPGFRASLPYPDIRNFSQREYGNRVGIFRVMDILDKYNIKATVAMDSTVAENYPFLVEQCLKRDWEFIGHGQTATRLITSAMTEEEEQSYISNSINTIERVTSRRPIGWMGPSYSESTRTPKLLAAEGIRYVCDWPNDEQPYKMKVPTGEMHSLPILLDLDDFYMLWARTLPIMDYSRLLKDSFDRLYFDGKSSGRLMTLNLHPWLIGQPYRSKYLDEALSYITGHSNIWKATGAQIVDWYAKNGD